MSKDVEIQNLSASEIEQVLRNVGYGENVVLRGAMDVATAEKMQCTDNDDQVSLLYNTWMTNPSICTASDGVSEQFDISKLASELYHIEQTYK